MVVVVNLQNQDFIVNLAIVWFIQVHLHIFVIHHLLQIVDIVQLMVEHVIRVFQVIIWQVQHHVKHVQQ